MAKTIHTFKLKDTQALDSFFAQSRFLPGTINFNPGVSGFWGWLTGASQPTISIIVDHNARLDRERNALEDNRHDLIIKLDANKVNLTYWTGEKIRVGGDASIQEKEKMELLHTIDNNIKGSQNAIRMFQAQIHSIDEIIEEIKADA